jgi:hypothetical protein
VDDALSPTLVVSVELTSLVIGSNSLFGHLISAFLMLTPTNTSLVRHKREEKIG